VESVPCCSVSLMTRLAADLIRESLSFNRNCPIDFIVCSSHNCTYSRVLQPHQLRSQEMDQALCLGNAGSGGTVIGEDW
jgi:hypothetical protein